MQNKTQLVAGRRTENKGIVAVLATWLGLTMAGCATDLVHRPAEAPAATPSKTVLFVHGMFVGPSCWDRWQPYFETKGYHTLAPAWPAHDGTAADARAAHPDPALAAVDLEAVVDHYRRIISELDEKPILIGHSMGGLVVQILLSEGYGSAAVAIDAAPPKGVFALNHAFIKSNGRILRGSLDEPLDMDQERFSYMFVNTLPEARQREIWTQYARPESRRVGRGATQDAGKVDFKNTRPPLLLLGGEHDHAVPPVIARKTWRRYRKAQAVTDYHEVAGADHWLIGSEGWQSVADYTLAWISEQQGRGVP